MQHNKTRHLHRSIVYNSTHTTSYIFNWLNFVETIFEICSQTQEIRTYVRIYFSKRIFPHPHNFFSHMKDWDFSDKLVALIEDAFNIEINAMSWF